MPPISVSLIMSGGASLGAFHGGALAALLTGLRRPARDGLIRIDAMGGTSAGAIASLLAAHAWLEGIDPVWMMHEAWVEQLSASTLRARSGSAPMSFERLEADIDLLLQPDDERRIDPAAHPLGLHVGLVNLHGLSYTLPSSGDDQGTTYDDWVDFTLQPEGGTSQLRTPGRASPLDAVLASASNPLAFAPRPLDRSRDGDRLTEAGRALRGDGTYWYADGEVMSSDPIGRVVRLARTVSAGLSIGRRVAIVTNPRSEGPVDGDFLGRDAAPSWLGGVKRLLDVLPAQAVSDDLARIGTRNAQLSMSQELASILDEVVDDELLARLAAVVDGSPSTGDREEGLDADATLVDVLTALAGVRGEERVQCEQISPRVLAPDTTTEAMLSGEHLGDFSGFVDRARRANDFLLGWDCAARWAEGRLEDLGLAPDVVGRVLEDLGAARPPGVVDQDLAGGGPASALVPLAGSLVRMALGTGGQLARRYIPLFPGRT